MPDMSCISTTEHKRLTSQHAALQACEFFCDESCRAQQGKGALECCLPDVSCIQALSTAFGTHMQHRQPIMAPTMRVAVLSAAKALSTVA